MEDPNLNPLDIWCPNIIDLIFQHLNVQQLLVLSEVAPDFSIYISTYKKFLKSVKFKINSSRSQIRSEIDLANFLRNRLRNYENLELDGNEVVTNLNVLVKNFKTPLKSISLTSMLFNRTVLLQNLFGAFRETLEEVKMNSIFIFNCDRKVTLSLPRLTRLEMIECNDQENAFIKRTSFVVNDCKDLETLKLLYAGVSEENQKKLLKENKNIKDLTLSDVKDTFFASLPYEVEFKLEKFAINFATGDLTRIKPNLSNFLESHLVHFEEIEINGWIGLDVLEIIFKMPSIKILRIRQAIYAFMNLDTNELRNRLETNRSLKELILTDDLSQYHSIWQNLLKKAPELNRLCQNLRILITRS